MSSLYQEQQKKRSRRPEKNSGKGATNQRWDPADIVGHRATIGVDPTGMMGAAMPMPDVTPAPDATTPPPPQAAPPPTAAPVSMFSMGNPARGSINLGGFMSPRANPNFDPANPGKELPYQQGGFFRRLMGDNANQLNQQYYDSSMRARLGENAAQAQQQRELELIKARNEGQLNVVNAENEGRRGLMGAEWQNRIGLANAEAQIRNQQMTQQQQFQQGQTQQAQQFQRSLAEDERNERRAERLGSTDPIIQADRENQQWNTNEQLNQRRLSQPQFGAGGQMAIPGEDNQWNVFHWSPPSQGGFSTGPNGQPIITPPSPGSMDQIWPKQGPPPNQPAAAPAATPDEIIKMLGVTARPVTQPQAAPAANPQQAGALSQIADWLKRNIQGTRIPTGFSQ